MYDDILKDLLNYAFDHGIGIEMVHANFNTPCLVFNESKLIILNLNWNKWQLPFAFAHEIAHILNKDENCLYQNSSYKIKFEYSADVKALEILIPIYVDYSHYSVDNVYPLMEQLKIPNRLIEETKNITKKCLTY
ncbi:ImmA/IrrE family metallo-endopeptidase [Apilactobacillus xinyiensis]|uniref:ImmA/IrrE family metallo-endopeptidase n=1 Tax=Apilactobacillus xinyiensis TaxID=2841032 RepID=UPI0020102B82|nr:hypothetical protein [Apilactobacillus xinyiensis]MCL0330668.1 hypothetical protein [Apilactobacillus xinyiensis]